MIVQVRVISFTLFDFSFSIQRGFIGMKMKKTKLSKHKITICPIVWTVHNNIIFM